MAEILRALLMGLYDPRVQIGLPHGIPHHDAHGVLHVEGRDGRAEQRPFIADRPRQLHRPSPEILRQVFVQAQLLGLQPRHLEIFVGPCRQVYDTEGALLFSQ